ncbi:MAG: hypothetical protein ACR2J8_09995, partial [Thermomicrobiales bacterium]
MTVLPHPGNRRRLVLAAAILAAAVAAALWFWLRVLPAHCPVASAQVVLDPGHGGDESGAINPAFGLIERDLDDDVTNR